MAKALSKKSKKITLNDKEKLFCHRYVSAQYNFCGTRAYMDTYQCKYTSAGVEANRFLKKPKIKGYIGTLMAEFFDETKISRLRILNQLSIQSFQQMSDYIDVDPKTRLSRMKTLQEIGEKGAAIAAMEVEQVSMVNGEDVEDLSKSREPVKTKIKFKLRNNEKSLELLMKYKNMITDNVDHNFPGGEFATTKQVDTSSLSDEELRFYIKIHEKLEAKAAEVVKDGKK